jgi:hypothetical protein
MIVEKILVMVSWLNSFMEMMLKWRMKRGVTMFRAPPGGPIAHMKMMSCRMMRDVSFRSYLGKKFNTLKHF